MQFLRRDIQPEHLENLKALLIWNRLLEPGDRIGSKLIRKYGAERALEHLRLEKLIPFDGLLECDLSNAFARWKPRLENLNLDDLINAAKRAEMGILLPTDPQWPSQLARLGDFEPIVLWYRGALGNFEKLARSVGVVGSRSVSRYGQIVTADVVSSVVGESGGVISGGALGVDAIAHRVALSEGGFTAALMAGALDNLYPAGNWQLFDEISHAGLLISEMSPGAKPTRWRFLQRNRLIAAMSQAVVVTEAGLRSGSINTVNHAIELDIPVFSIPGPVTSPTSAGCNMLIRDQKAMALIDPRDLPAELGWTSNWLVSEPILRGFELRLLDFLSKTEQTIESLAAQAGLNTVEARMGLGSLQLINRAKRGQKGGWLRTF